MRWFLVLHVTPALVSVHLAAQDLTLKVPLGHSGEITCAAFSPDSRYLVSGSQDKTLILWDVESGKELRSFRGHGDQVNAVAFSPDGSMIVSGSGGKYVNDGQVKVWNAMSGGEAMSIKLKRQVTSVTFSPDGKLIAAGMNTGKFGVWDLESGKELKSLRTKGDAKDWDITMDSVTFTDQDHIMTLTNRGLREVWEWRSGGRLLSAEAETYYREYDELTFTTLTSPDHRFILKQQQGYLLNEGQSYYGLTLWEVGNSDRSVAQFVGHSWPVASVAYSPAGNFIVSDAWRTNVWDLASGSARGYHRSSATTYPYHGGVGVSANGRNIITPWDTTILLWDARTGQVIRKFEPASENVTAVASSPTGFFVGCGTSDGKVWIWEAYTGKLFQTFQSSWEVSSIAFSPDEQYVVSGNTFGEVWLWHLYDPAASKLIREHGDMVSSVSFSSNGLEIISASYDGEVRGYGSATGYDQVNSVAVSPDSASRFWAIGSSDGSVEVIDWSAGEFVKRLSSDYSEKVNSVAFSPDSRFLITGSEDGTVRILESSTGNEVAKLITLDTADWVVIAPSGLFDASPGAMNLMHFTYGLEVIALDQLKERYYEPGLLSKLMGFNAEKPREAHQLAQVELFPSVSVSVDANSRLTIQLSDRGGGIGETVVSLNGTEIIAGAQTLGHVDDAGNMTISIDLQPYRDYVVAGDNAVAVSAFNSAHYLRSPAAMAHFNARDIASRDPHLWLVSIGVADYTGDQIDLTFPANDAYAMKGALEQGARNLFNVFGSEMTHSYLLTTDQDHSVLQPTRGNILNTFERIADSALASDVLVVYLSGHGINWGGTEGDFYYLTKEAYTANAEAYNDPLIRESSSLSSETLVALINKIPAQKRVLMIDACGSGRAVENLMEKRSISSTTVRALDRMRDRTGMHVISGCAADAVSYEASRFGQGILTYALLEGMKGTALRDNEFVDVDLLFQKARDRVPELARDIGGIQQPLVFSPSTSGSFDIGKLSEADRQKIQLNAVKPIFVMSALLDKDQLDDALGLSVLVDAKLSEISARGMSAPIVFVNARTFPEGCKITGLYSMHDSSIVCEVKLKCGEQSARTELVTTAKDELVKMIVQWVSAVALKPD